MDCSGKSAVERGLRAVNEETVELRSTWTAEGGYPQMSISKEQLRRCACEGVASAGEGSGEALVHHFQSIFGQVQGGEFVAGKPAGIGGVTGRG